MRGGFERMEGEMRRAHKGRGEGGDRVVERGWGGR